jgi:hypothetical protein
MSIAVWNLYDSGLKMYLQNIYSEISLKEKVDLVIKIVEFHCLTKKLKSNISNVQRKN